MIDALLVALPAIIVVSCVWIVAALPRNGRRAEAKVVFFVIQAIAYAWLLLVEILGQQTAFEVLNTSGLRALVFRALQAGAFVYLLIILVSRINGKPRTGPTQGE